MIGRAHFRRGPGRARQRGFTLVTGVFLITILFLLSAYMVSFRAYQDAGTSLDTLGARAIAAARAGGEWAAYQALRGGGCAAGTTSLALGGSLATFTATVTTSASSYNEAGTTVTVCNIVSNACNQPAAGACPNGSPGTNYAERQVTTMVAQ